MAILNPGQYMFYPLENNRVPLSGRILILSFLSFFTSTLLLAEGSKQLSPNIADTVLLVTNSNAFGDFATYGSNDVQRLNIKIFDHTSENVYLGFSPEVNGSGAISSGDGDFWFRIKDPNGIIVHGPYRISTANSNTPDYPSVAAGPDVLNVMSGYSTADMFASFDPAMNGDFYIEFSEDSLLDLGNTINILWFDITVVENGMIEKPGRLWSNSWSLRTPQIGADTPPECDWDREFNGVFYSYTLDGFVSKIDFTNSGLQGLNFSVSFGANGPGTTGNVLLDRQSVPASNLTANAADHMAFLNEPDVDCFPSSTDSCGVAEIVGIQCINGAFCINVLTTHPGQVEIILDFANNNNLFDPDTTDVILVQQFPNAGDTLCIMWDGLKGDGSVLSPGEPIPTIIRYTQGVQHYAMYDVEFLINGFCVETVRPLCPGMDENKLYWDDSRIPDNVFTMGFDESQSGTGQPQVQFNGCVCQTDSCRTWTTFMTSGQGGNPCAGTATGYGEQNTLNTWWFASVTESATFNLPIVSVDLVGDSTICIGDSTQFFALASPDTITSYTYSWTGPNSFTGSADSTGFIMDAGEYCVTVRDTVTNCEATMCRTLLVNQLPESTISFTCLATNQQNANVSLQVTAGAMPFTFLWSNGSMMQNLMDVTPGEYSVIITDDNGCISYDTIVVEGCCVLDITCPIADGGQFSCITDIPIADTTLVLVTDYCEPLTIDVVDLNDNGLGCIGDTLIITREYQVMDGAGSLDTCRQIFRVVDNENPTINLNSCPNDTTVICMSPTDTMTLGSPGYTDNCTPSNDLILRMRMDSVGFDGVCANNDQIGIIQRTFFSEDNCGNVDSTCTQTIIVIDSIAPAFSTPPNIQIECSMDTLPATTGMVSNEMDNCSAITITYSDMIFAGICPVIDSIERTWSVTDACGNVSTGLQIIIRVDSQAPTFTAPADIEILCDADISPSNTGEVTDTMDLCSAITIRFQDELIASQTCPANDTILRSWIATDACGNADTLIQIINRIDTIPPSFTVPSDTLIQCTQDSLPITTGEVLDTTDNCSSFTLSFMDVVIPGTCIGEDTIIRTWTAIDACFNVNSQVQRIVRVDTVPPVVVSCPMDLVIDCDESIDTMTTGVPNVTDNCSAIDDITITFTDENTNGTCGTDAPLIRTFTITDDCGNMATCVQELTIQDTISPMLVQGSCPMDTVIDCTVDVTGLVLPNPAYTDNCSDPQLIAISTMDDSTGFTGVCANFVIGQVSRTFFAVDICGNIDSSCVVNIFVQDTVAPQFTTPTDTIIQCTEDFMPANTGEVLDTTDNCSSIMIMFNDNVVAGTCAAEDTIFRTWIASDVCGNVSSAVQKITRIDTVPPSFSTPVDITLQCTQDSFPSTAGNILDAADLCSDLTVSFTDMVIQGNCVGSDIITRTWLVMDACGNAASDVQLITRVDTVAPTFDVPSDTIVDCTQGITPNDVGTISNIADNCSGTTSSSSDVSVPGPCLGIDTTYRTWTVEDGCGNIASAIQTIIRIDTIAPVLDIATCPQDLTINCDSPPLMTPDPFYMDNCGMVNVSSDADSMGFVAPMVEGVITITYYGADDCGNIDSTCIQMITVQDILAPVITSCPSDTLVDCIADISTDALGLPTATDNCAEAADLSITFSDDSTGFDQACFGGLIVRTFYVEDPSNNVDSSCVQEITVQDTLMPMFEVPGDITIDCTVDLLDVTILGNVENVTDNCSQIVDTSFTDELVQMGCDGTGVIERTWTVADACQNMATGVQTITIQDTIGPILLAPDDITISCDQNEMDTMLTGSMVNISDACSMFFTFSFEDDRTGLDGCNGTGVLIRNWSAVDECDNITIVPQLITIVDTTAPMAVCQNISLDFDDGNILSITPDFADGGSTDNCGDVNLNLSQTIFDCTAFDESGQMLVTLFVTDDCGNSASCVSTVSAIGGTGIELICPNDIEVYLGPGECQEVVNYIIEVNPLCSADEPVLIQTDDSGFTSGDFFQIGETFQSYMAYNENGDTARCSFTITLFENIINTTSLACNDTITVALDTNCQGFVNPDMILEGEQYTCYDGYIVTIENVGSELGGIMIGPDQVGMIFTVTITDPKSDNSCWGTLIVQDNIPPRLECHDVEISCVTGTAPVFDPFVDTLNLPFAPTAFDACGTVTFTYEDVVEGDECAEGMILREWTGSDPSGNTTVCTQTIAILPATVDQVIFPETHYGECNGTSSPTVTGYPTVDGQPIGESVCNLFTAFWDKPITDCGGSSKIVRTWMVVDWCTQELAEGTQIIKLSDDEGPVMTCPANMEVGTDFWFCYANVSVPKPTVVDACGSEYTLSLSASAGIVRAIGNNYVINELPLGENEVTWTAIDACGNESSCTFIIEVVDEVPPVPNCDEHTIVSLTNDAPYGITLVSADVFDDGSYDNCSEVTFEARRMETCIDFDWTTNGACVDDVPNGIYSRLTDGGMAFKPCVPFACCDVHPDGGGISGPIMIELKVTDAAGNENFCMVEIEVQDKLAPFIECPTNIVVSCDFWFDSEVVTGQRIPLSQDPMTSVFGTVLDAYEVHDDQSARQPIVINDPGRPTNPSNEYYLPQPYTWGIDGWADDNCDVNLDVRITIEDDCSGDDLPANVPDHAIKYIERRFTATDGQNNSDNCRQVIWVVDFDPFYISDDTCADLDRNDGVKWPCDKLYDTCPDSIPVDEPIIYDDNCSLIGVIYEDTRFDFVDGACYKILREWTVIDWCQYETNTGAGIWYYTQVIKVIDSDGPEFFDCPEGPITLCAGDAGVSLPDNNQVFLGEADPNKTSCSVHVSGNHTVQEFCSDYVIYDVKVYPFNGIEYISLVDKTQVDLEEGQATISFDTKTAPVQQVRLNGLPYNNPYCLPNGQKEYHRILWSVEDGCGNLSTCEYLVRLEDCKQPSPVCINGISTVVMPIGGAVSVWAKEYDVSSIDDCTPSEALTFSFSGDSYQPSAEYNCENVPTFGAELEVNVWVADEGNDHNCDGQIEWSERNKDFCTTTIVITDNDGVCPNSGNAVAGEILTYTDLAAVENTIVTIHSATSVFPTLVTAEDGKYHFIVPAGDYSIEAERNDDHMNGVSTLDLVRIQKHLLGVEPFTSAYQFIAADANNNEGVSALDLVEIRKLILGIVTEFPNNESWRFVDPEFVFADPANPWPFNEVLNVNNSVDQMDEDFMAIKVGDLNNTVVANATQVVIRNGNGTLTLLTDDREVSQGETIEVTFATKEAVSLLGYQFTMRANGLEFVDVKSESNNITAEHIGLIDGQITTSWHHINAPQVSAEEGLFTFEFVATQSGQLSQMLDINSSITAAEAYNASSELLDVALEFRGNTEADFALYQNEPNPFNGVTVIGFDLPHAGLAVLNIYDIDGRLVKRISDNFNAGYNQFEIKRKELGANGAYYYRLISGEYAASKKMITAW